MTEVQTAPKSPTELLCERMAALTAVKNPAWVAKQSAEGSLCAVKNTPLAPTKVNQGTQVDPSSTPNTTPNTPSTQKEASKSDFEKPIALKIDPAHMPKIGAYLQSQGATLRDSALGTGAILRAGPGTHIMFDGSNTGAVCPIPEGATITPGMSNKITGVLKDLVITLPDGKELYCEIQKTPVSPSTTPNTLGNAAPEKTPDMTAASVDSFMASYSGAPGDFMNTKAHKPQFDALIQNWDTVSDASVAKFKSLLVEYAKSQGVTIPSNCWLTPTTKEWHPALWTTVGDKKITIYNAGAV
jgi:hypothetical protein